MMKTLFSLSLLVGHLSAAPAPVDAVEEKEAEHGREMFPLYSIGTKRAANKMAASRGAATGVAPQMSMQFKGPIKALEQLALNDDLNTVVQSDSMCTRRHAMARAAGLAAGLTLATVNAPAFAAATKSVKMGSDSGQLVFQPDEIKICKGDTVEWVNNKGGPHNVVFDEDAIPSGVSAESISMDDQLGEEGDKYTKKFDVAGSYAYFCEPHRGAGMNAVLIVE